MIDTHKWLGVASTVVAVLAAGCAVKSQTNRGSLLGLRVGLIVGTSLVLATGYFGGELVFEKDHILKHWRKLIGSEPVKPEQTGTSDRTVTEKMQEKTPLLKVSEISSNKVDFVKDIAPLIKDACF